MESYAATWPDCMSEEQWSVYQQVIAGCREAGLQFAVGGGLAMGVFTGRWRETKDIDLYVLREDLEIAQQVLSRAGLVDYYEQLPYDRAWIYRSTRDKIIVDIIFSMANHKIDVDETWITDGPEFTLRGETFRVVPAEEMIWAKLYVLQKDRCDWPDVFNLIIAQHKQLNWQRLLDRLGDDAPLLRAVLTVLEWLCPALAQELPPWLGKSIEEAERSERPPAGPRHADLLDRRSWFA